MVVNKPHVGSENLTQVYLKERYILLAAWLSPAPYIIFFFVTLNEAGSFACCEFDCYSELQVTAAVLLRDQMAMVLWDWELVIKIILFYAVSMTFCGKPLSVVFEFILICRQHFTSSFRLGSLYSLNSVSWFLYILYKHDPIIVENILSLNCGYSFRY